MLKRHAPGRTPGASSIAATRRCRTDAPQLVRPHGRQPISSNRSTTSLGDTRRRPTKPPSLPATPCSSNSHTCWPTQRQHVCRSSPSYRPSALAVRVPPMQYPTTLASASPVARSIASRAWKGPSADSRQIPFRRARRRGSPRNYENRVTLVGAPSDERVLRLEVQVSGDAGLPARSGRVPFSVERLAPMNAGWSRSPHRNGEGTTVATAAGSCHVPSRRFVPNRCAGGLLIQIKSRLST
jgi:hypothetical protein